MSAKTIYYSLPKTQPSQRSSSKGDFSRAVILEQIDTCPEVTEFKHYLRSNLYTHNMDVDFGRLQRPAYCGKQIGKSNGGDEMEQGSEGRIEIQTRRFAGISSLTDNKDDAVDDKKTEKKNQVAGKVHTKTITVRLPTNEVPKDTRRKSIRTMTESYIGASGATESNKKIPSTKLQYVHAYKQTNGKATAKLEVKTEQKVSSKKIHSRILRTIFGGGKMQTRIINYPDNSDYLKLCGLN